VNAILSIYGEHCAIMEFSSLSPSSGYAREALQWLRENFATVAAIDPGTEAESPNSFSFWAKMAAEGMIDSLVDAEGYKIFEGGKWVMARIDEQLYPDTYQALCSESEIDRLEQPSPQP
jgi:hypothetical protein